MAIPLAADRFLPPSDSSSSSTPPRSQLLRNLTLQTHLLRTLFTLLSSTSPNALTPQISASLAQAGISLTGSHPVEALHSALVDQTFDLERLIADVYVHQAAWAGLMAKRAEVVALEKQVKGALRTLEKGREELEECVKDGRKVVESIQQSEERPISSNTLLATAQNLAAHSSAPVSSLLLPQDKAQFMPWPTEAAMRQGLLFMMGGSMSGMGDTGKIGDEPELPAQQMEIDPVVHHPITHEEERRRYDPEAVFHLELNSDSEED